MSLTKQRVEQATTLLREADFSDEEILQFRDSKPKRIYSKDSSWKEEAKSIYLKTGIITRQQIKSAKGFPTNSSNVSQVIKRFIKEWLPQQTGDVLTLDKKADAWSVQEDLSEHVSWFKSKNRMNKATFEFNCERRGVAPESMKTALRDAGVMFTQQGEMIV